MEASVSKVESPRLSPSRRRSSTINNRPPHSGSEQDWTAARCNRLLRALTSRVAILKKDISRLQTATSKSDATESNATHRQRRVNASPGDADWAHPRKKVRRTYSGHVWKANNRSRPATSRQTSQKDERRSIPGDISVPTPLLHRTWREPPGGQCTTDVRPGENISSPEGKSKKRSRTRDGEALFQLSRTMREIRKNISLTRYTTYEGIYYGLEGLLKVTAGCKEEQSQKGPASLLSMCLRAVPHYIAREEMVLAAQLEETGSRSAIYQRDVSTEIYDDLEAFGSSQHGWKHLRTVVRSHGIQVLCTAINEGLIDMEFCGILVSLCINMRATREAEILLSSLLSVGPFSRPKSVYTRFDDDTTTRPLSMFWNFTTRKAGSSSYQYRQLSSMISSGALPISWLATKEFVSFWERAVREFSSNSVNPDAITFFVTVLPLFAAYGDARKAKGRVSEATDTVLLEAVSQTFSNLIATLTAMVILNKKTAADTQDWLVSSTDYQDILDLLQACFAQWKLYNSVNVKGTFFALAIIIVHRYNGSSPDTDLVDFLFKCIGRTNRAAQPHTPRNDFLVLLYSIARCCGRGASNSGFEHLQHLHGLLEMLSCDGESNAKQIAGEVIVDSAFAFARQVPDRGHLEYAVSMEERYHMMKVGSAVDSPSKHGEGRDGYRWEEGISEWVVATPAASSVKFASQRGGYSSEDSECNTPFFRSTTRVRTKYPTRSIFPSSLESSPEPGHRRVPSSPEYYSTESDSYCDEDVDITTASPESTNRSVSLEAYKPNDELLMSSSPGQDLETDELCLPDSPSLRSDTSKRYRNSQHYMYQAPRLNKKPSRHSLNWQLFDHSDDELSCLSALSEHNSSSQNSRRTSSTSSKSQLSSRAKRLPSRVSLTAALETSLLYDSEDELGI